MALDTSSSRKPTEASPRAPSTRAVLLAVLLPLILLFTGTSLLLVWHRIRQQVISDLSTDLRHSVRTFQNAEAEHFGALQREAALLSDLPSLKALLTTNDDQTIQNASIDFWKTSGGGLFGLAGPDGHLRAVNTPFGQSDQNEAALAEDLREAIKHPGGGYLLGDVHLFRYATSRVYFGSGEKGTLLGTVISGYELNSTYLAETSSAVDADVAFVSHNLLVGSSIPIATQEPFSDLLATGAPGSAVRLTLNQENYIVTSHDLSTRANVPLQVIFYRSLRPTESEIRDISRQLILLGVSMVLLGSFLMIFLAQRLTKPLVELTRRVQAFGERQHPPVGAPRGTMEVRQLAVDFEAMQARIEASNRARLEGERLATIGSMATSVSHDLRHHLASIYANAEFLAAPGVTEEERTEFFEDIQAAVLDTTEMLESLTIFSRTGRVMGHVQEQAGALLQRAVAQVRIHPAAANVYLGLANPSIEASIVADGKQIERALFNLLLNACQSRRPTERASTVVATLEVAVGVVSVLIADNGVGIPVEVRHNLFEPFVSCGKQNGTGLGLTLARRIAQDHNGNVDLLSSDSMTTVFRLTLPLRVRTVRFSSDVETALDT